MTGAICRPSRPSGGITFHDAALFAHLSVADNLAFGLSPEVRRRSARRAAVALEQAGMSGLGPRDPATLSGRPRARAALMRTLLALPQAELRDEPFSGLDRDRRGEILRFAFWTIRRAQVPALLVTDDAGDAGAAGCPVIALS